MNWTNKSLANPAAVAVCAAVVLLLGAITIFRLPVQLFPDITQPQITIQASWRAASPREIESEIVKPLEEVLQGIPGVEKMQAFANPGNAFIILQFALETDMNRSTLEVISRLNRLPPMPADSDPPVINFGGFGGGASDTLIWFFAQSIEDGRLDQNAQRSFIEDVVAPRLEAIEGVSSVNTISWSGSGEELQIMFDPYKAAELGISMTQLASQVGRTSDVSGGFVDVGRRQYSLRFKGRYEPEQLAGLILDWRDGRPVTLGDIATISLSPGRVSGFGYQNGNRAFGVQILKTNDANVLETLDRVKAAVAEMNEGVIGAAGLRLEKSFDPSVFILRAISLLTNNLFIGMMLAIGILWWFLRQSRATLLIAMTIPLSLLGTFIVLDLAGRSVNVISLAGLAFATGMVLDAAIVVLENIVRLREKGVASARASEEGTKQVWGALLASTATTVAIFVPVMFLKDVEG
ncbi:MAG: efflux RND transporter permease subunit, partial [Sphingomonadales bacterium]